MAAKGNKYAVGNSGPPPRKYTKEFIEKIAKDMLIWVDQPDALFLEQFVGDHPDFVDMKWFPVWAKEEGVFGDAYSKVKRKLVGKLKANSAMKNFDGNFVAKILPLVDQEYREWRQQELKLEGEAKQQLIVQTVDYKKNAK